MYWELVKAVYGFRSRVEEFKQAIDFGELEDFSSCARNCREFNVAIALHCLFQAVEKGLNASAVQAANLGTVQHQTWAVCFQ